jgi:RNA polymerase sigma-70 factor, ECF subfamily
MGLIHIEVFTTLDLVGSRPVAPTRIQWGSPSAATAHQSGGVSCDLMIRRIAGWDGPGRSSTFQERRDAEPPGRVPEEEPPHHHEVEERVRERCTPAILGFSRSAGLPRGPVPTPTRSTGSRTPDRTLALHPRLLGAERCWPRASPGPAETSVQDTHLRGMEGDPMSRTAGRTAAVRDVVGPDRQVMMEPRPEDELLTSARQGDERAFEELVRPFRAELHAHIYRMAASTRDADEVLQDTLLRAWRGLAGFEGRSALRTWLYAIATRACLTHLARQARRAMPAELGPARDPLSTEWSTSGALIDPYPSFDARSGLSEPEARYELREAVELAFVAACQHLPARQRAVLILRDVMGFSARETAATLETSVASVTSALQRARATVATRLPDRSQQMALRELSDPTLHRLVTAYATAWERGDPEAILSLLTEDASFSMPPYTVWCSGRASIADFLVDGPLHERWRLRPMRANGQLAFGCYAWRDDIDGYVGHSIDVIALRGRAVAQIVAFLEVDGRTLERFGLPAQLT